MVRDLFREQKSPAKGMPTAAGPRPVQPGGGAGDLHLSREHLEIAQRVADLGSIERDLRTGQMRWSPQMFRMLGFLPGEIEPTIEKYLERVHPDDVPLVRSLHDATWAGKVTYPTDYRLLLPGGRVRWVRREGTMVADEHGQPALIVSTVLDITERRRLEHELRHQQEHLLLAQRVARVGSIERDLITGRVVLSDELYHLVGVEPGEIAPTLDNMLTFVHPDDVELAKDLIINAWRGDDVPPAEYRLVRRDGTIVWVRREATITRDERGQPRTSLATLIDITERKRLEHELQQRQQHLLLAQSVAHVGSIARDLVAKTVTASDEIYRLLGIKRGTYAPTLENMLRFVHPDDANLVTELHERSWRGVDTPPTEFRIIRADGELVWVRREAIIMRDEGGKPLLSLSTMIDITERKRLETELLTSADELRRSQEHLQRAQSVGAIGSSELDLRTGVSHWSDEYFRLLGLDPATDRPGREAFLAAILPEDHHKLTSREEILGHDGPIPPIELRSRLPNGEIRWLQRQIVVSRDADGKPMSILFTLQDVTERRHMEEALIAYANEVRSSREHLSRAQSAGRIGSAEVDLRTGHLYWSEGLYGLLGIDSDVEPSFEPFAAAVHPEDRDQITQGARLIDAGQLVEPLTFRVVHRDGDVRWIHRVSEYARDANGRPMSLIITYSDVTEARRAQEERARLQEQLAHGQRLDSLGALTGGIAHDFNNILTSILGSAALLNEDAALSPDAQRLVRAVVKATERGAELTRRLLSFGRRQMLSPVALDLKTVAGDLDTLLRRTLGEEIALFVRPAPDVWTVKADKGQLEAAIVNLAINARDAMPGGGTLTIEMDNRVLDDPEAAEQAGVAPGEFVAISVSDSGAGMSHEVLQRAFEPFFTTKDEGQGTGLGLAMVYGFAKQSGGYANIYSEVGIGTRVTLALPRSAEHAAAPAQPKREARALGGSEHILLVEDDEMVRDFVRTALGRLGYHVTAAPDAADAMTYVDDANHRVDLLLTDLMLPGGTNGNELAALATARRPGLRVLFASGYTKDALIRQGRLEPGQLLIPKPFAGRELAAKVREALGD